MAHSHDQLGGRGEGGESVRATLIGIYLVLFALVTSLGTAQAQAPRQVPLFPAAVNNNVPTPGRYFYLAQAVIEYGPGAFSAAGSEQSRRFFTVMEGELSFTVGGKTEAYAAGKNFSVAPGVVVKGTNEGRTARARVFVTSLVPARGEGAATVPGTGPSATPPRIVYSSRIPIGPLPEVINVIQVGNRYEPGFVTGLHVMNETHAMLHLEGTTSYEYLDGFKETFGPGQGGQMYVGRPGVMANRTTAPTAFLFTWLATPGKPLTSAWQGN